MVGLVPFTGGVSTVVEWIVSPEEAILWAGATTWPVPPELLVTWHAEPEVVPFMLLADGVPAGYGELWEDETEVELARLLVDPRRRRQGLGRRLVEGLVTEARRRGFADIWLRVVPTNEPAVCCYLASGFVRTSPNEEAEFNLRQPREYAWMRYGPPAAVRRGGSGAD